MIRYYESLFLSAMLHLDKPHSAWVAGSISDEQYKSDLTVHLDMLREEAARAEMSSIVSAVNMMKRWIKPEADVRTVMAMAINLVGTIQAELTKDMFFRVAAEDRQYYEKLQISDAAAAAFPSCVRDLQDAGRCFAFDQWTASVLHLMRALEIPIAALAKALAFTPSSPNWEIVLNECEREIRKIGQVKATPNWKDDEQFYSEAALNFRYFKNAWRNHVTHGRQTYDKREAYEILTHIAAFMDHLGQRIAE